MSEIGEWLENALPRFIHDLASNETDDQTGIQSIPESNSGATGHGRWKPKFLPKLLMRLVAAVGLEPTTYGL